jgi:succinoglycan biosynthesis transport protein ExoP
MGPDETAPEFRAYLAVLRRHARLIVAVTAITLFAGLFYAFRQVPVYQSEAEVLVRPVTLIPTGASSTDELSMDDEQRLATSVEVTSLVAERLGKRVPEDSISVDAAADSHTLLFSGIGRSSRDAQRIAQAFAQAYLDLRRRQALSDLTTAAKPIRAQLDQLENQRQVIQRQLAATGSETSRLVLTTQLSTLLTEEANVKQSLNQFILPQDVNVGQILKPATHPSVPSSPDLVKTGTLALFVGISLAIGTAFVREHLDQRVWNREDLEQLTRVPVLAVLRGPGRWSRVARRVAMNQGEQAGQLGSPPADDYRSLRWRVLATASRHNLTSLIVTGLSSADSRSAITAQLGIALAETGQTVLLIADPRKPLLDRYFSLDSLRDGDAPSAEPAQLELADQPRSESLWRELCALRENLWLLRLPSDLTLSESEPIPKFLNQAREFADLVLIDAPAVSDVRLLDAGRRG